MIESDQSDKETQDEIPPSKISDNPIDTTELRQKRLREETSEDEKLDLPSKKLCTSIDEKISENISEANGTAEEIKKNSKNIDIDDKKDKINLVSEENKNESAKESHVVVSDIKNNEISITNDIANKQENESNILTDVKQQGNIHIETISNFNTNNVTIEEKTEIEEEDNVKSKRKNKKFQIEDAEVVEGLELSVECASDKESSSSSESESEKDKQLKPKTIIVKAKPNDSELDVSSSEADKSDSQETLEIKPKQTGKKEKKRGRTSFSKTKNTDSEENNDDISDEDYSPKTKKKLKKAGANKKFTKSATESKKGGGRARKKVKKPIENVDGEDENSNITEDLKSEENTSDRKSVKSKSENESDSEDNSQNEKSKTKKPEDDRKIQLLKKYIRLAGIHVKSYNDLWASCKSNAAKVRCLRELLAKNGINGRPTVEKCKRAKEKNESLKDVAELNTSNIISEGRVTRAQRNKESTKPPETPTKHREARSTFKRVLTVVDSDSE
ncbi:DNA topoisomerase 2-alpha-like isoform X1 [Bombus pascuorum]|uniref:DNA topoisomerase 2-alpha-like isoform X1 n=1 Tax=Bombus pascuorum TaxID=65598 RepID=UPI0021308346|nr:DNA topoisomerase 2-alpha-like isoform X1 [Bombus pascuorum]XP_060817308.1 DNA topoisomerase 2-alpha-like isoform X1 [Bombus pascuorum]XP_060817309.1 DNA topoisomerase 2-alpha-like isoform X1 [Bombus pascuorum]XP_060817310.1 DNA topoisomerase 2-alpha-like isoform X1 [Bombus pascuorum]